MKNLIFLFAMLVLLAVGRNGLAQDEIVTPEITYTEVPTGIDKNHSIEPEGDADSELRAWAIHRLTFRKGDIEKSVRLKLNVFNTGEKDILLRERFEPIDVKPTVQPKRPYPGKMKSLVSHEGRGREIFTRLRGGFEYTTAINTLQVTAVFDSGHFTKVREFVAVESDQIHHRIPCILSFTVYALILGETEIRPYTFRIPFELEIK